MSGFSTQWLDLREPADHAARDPGLLAQVETRLGGRASVTLVDLGCGTGSTFRALAPRLPAAQSWRLVDHDPVLIQAATARIGLQAHVQAHPRDLRALDTLPLAGADLVTASALLDLAGADWLAALAAALHRAGVGLYAALNYDGQMHWSPSLADDAAVLDAFNRHQCSDKGLGPALGPRAGATLAQQLRAQGFTVHTAPSPWRVQGASPFQRALLEGIALAAAEAGLGHRRSQAWLAQRLALMDRGRCHVGHLDVLAWPP